MIGRGAMGAVYEAHQIALDRKVAIKLLPLEISGDEVFVERFRREARALARLNHPNIISVYEFGSTLAGHLFFVMEFVAGANLREMIHGPGVAPAQAVEIFGGVCDALAYAHGKGVVHRDIKPANVMVSADGQVKVADFGLVRLVDSAAGDAGHTVTGTVIGTPEYMSPEQMRGIDVDRRADIYSLGVMLYEMLCREVPRGVFDPPSSRVPGIAKGMDDVVTTAMQQEPGRRYQSTPEMKTALCAASAPVPAPPKPGGVPATAAAAGGSRRAIFIGVGAVVAAIAIAAGFLAGPGEPAGSRSGAGEAHGGRPAGGAANTVSTAGKDAPFVNTLGMKFVPVQILGGPTGGQRVLFGVWDTRVQDYEVFVTATKRAWPKPGFAQDPTHPAVNVSWDDAQLFCQWLTGREQEAGRLPAGWRYRLPSDHEWSCLVEIGAREEAEKPPFAKSRMIKDVFPWGDQWPPPEGAGNYVGEEVEPALATGKYPWIKGVIAGYRDGFENTSPVGSFAANRFGLCDVGGNVWQWCEDWFDKERTFRVLRGASWSDSERGFVLSSGRQFRIPGNRYDSNGFRCVLAPAAGLLPEK